MSKIILAAITTFMLSTFTTYSQTQDSLGAKRKIFVFTEQQPAFPGGEAAMMDFLKANIIYPQSEMKNGVWGTVFVTFVVGEDGGISEVREARGVKGGPGLTVEAIRVVKKMPRWTPGKVDGRPVAVQYNLPIRFALGSRGKNGKTDKDN